VRRRRAASRCAQALLASAAFAAGCAGQPNYIGLPPPAEPGAIAGAVLDGSGRALPGQIVAIGAEKTTSDGEGRFAFPTVPAGYDLAIASPDGSRATVYQGITRRDPVVVHDGPRAGAPAHGAQLKVMLSGQDAAAAAGDRWQVRFVARGASATMSGKIAWTAAGGKLEAGAPLTVAWDGGDTITGVVMAFSVNVVKGDIPLALFAQQPITVRDSQTATVDLTPARVGVVRRPRPRVILPNEDPGFAPNYTEEYRLPAGGLAVKMPGRMGQTYDITDLRAFGLQLCGFGFQWNPYVRSSRTACGGDPAKPTVLPLPSPPVFTAPAWDTVAEPGLRFAWSAVPDAVYHLTLTTMARQATREQPTVEIFTTLATAGWPDLSAAGIAFPGGIAAYKAVIGARGPFASIDAFVAPQRWADWTPADRWSAESQDLSIAIQPTLGKEEAACRFENVVVCADIANAGPYNLQRMNQKIRRYPDFAAAVNIHCVRDCSGVEGYTKAYDAYAAAHPGFDASEPLTPFPRHPRPPPEMFKGRPRPD
jgi:hypothetical protein